MYHYHAPFKSSVWLHIKECHLILCHMDKVTFRGMMIHSVWLIFHTSLLEHQP